MRLLVVVMLIGACGGESDGRCRQAVDHIFELTMMGPPGSKPGAEEAWLIESVKAQTLSTCRSEGLSPAQTACVLAARYPDWDDQLRACPAFAAKPSSWVIVRPTRDERRALRGLPPIPDGPRERSTHYAQLIALPSTMCGLTDAGSVACWGEPLAAAFPAGTFVQIASTGEISCGRDASGTLHCASSERASGRDDVPSDALSDFALASWGGCGVRAADGQIVCWSQFDDAVRAPVGTFTSVAVNHTGVCGRTVEGGTQCSGEAPPALPPRELIAYSSDAGSCSIDRMHELSCTGTDRLGPPPVGKFDTVAISRGHACATRTGGGTVCWGENDEGACNVPP